MWKLKAKHSRTLEIRDLLILAALVKNQDTNKAYARSLGIQSFATARNEQVDFLPERQLLAETWPHYAYKEKDRQILYNGVANIII